MVTLSWTKGKGFSHPKAVTEAIERVTYDWRAFLTADEKAVLTAADLAKSSWLKLNEGRAGIVNRAIQRAKYAARTE